MSTVPTYNAWAILLCKWSDDLSEPFPVLYYENLFSSPGIGLNNMVDFFRDYTHGNLDLSGSQVFGWFVLPHARSEYTGSGANPQGRQDLINWCKAAATAAGVDLSQFFGVVSCLNISTDLFGDLGYPAVVCDNGTSMPSPLGQEMLHGYGLNHARLNGSTADYQDPYDVMSVFNAFMASDPNFTQIGPGLNSALMDSKGWLDPDRVWTYLGAGSTVQLRPHHRRDLPGFLVAKVGQFYAEFRMNEGWDAGLLAPVVLVHRFDPDGHSYLMQVLAVGSTFTGLEPGVAWLTVNVNQIDGANRIATLIVASQPLPTMSVTVKSVETLTIQVTVADQRTGSPIEGATVTVFASSGSPLPSKITGSNGTATLKYGPCYDGETHKRLPCDGMVTKDGYRNAGFEAP
jgi:hypothetical protein